MARKLIVEIVGDASSLEKSFRQAEGATNRLNRQMSLTFRGVAAGAFSNLGRQVAFASSAFLGAAGLTAVMKNSIGIASNLTEQTNKIGVVFGDSAQSIEAWGKTTATSIGIANDQALEAAGTFGGLFRTVGLAGRQNAQMSRSLVELAADMASFNNASPEDTLAALRSGLVGEAEPLRRFQVLLSEARVSQEAMRETGKRNATQLTQQDKLLARYNLILRDTKIQQGDFAKTADGLANAQRSLSAEFRDTLGVIGKELLPVVGQAARAMRDWLAKPENQKKVQQDTKKTVGFLGDVWHVTKNIAGGFKDVADAVNQVHLESMKLDRFLRGRLVGATTTAGQSIADRVPGLAPGGPGTFTRTTGGGRATGAAGVGGGGGGRLSLQGQLNQLQARLAQALTTATQVDERGILVLEQSLLKRWVAHTKDWKKRRDLYDQLAGVQNQIAAIDKDAADAREAAAKKELDAEKARVEKRRAHIRAMREAWQKQLSALRDAAGGVRGEFGGLPFQQAPTGILGVPGPSAGGFVGAYAKQTRSFVNFYRDLRRLRKAGAPRGLVEQFREAGVDTAGATVTGLLAHPRQLKRLAGLYRERERVVQQIAHADIHARIVNLHVAGSRPGATVTSQRAGRTAGARS